MVKYDRKLGMRINLRRKRKIEKAKKFVKRMKKV